MKKRCKQLLKEIKKLLKEQKIEMNIEIVCNPHIEVNPIIIGCIPKNNYPEVSTIPTVKRYFYIPSTDIHLTDTTIIPATLFINDAGNHITEFMVFEPNGYLNLYINGVMQEGNLYMLNSISLTFTPVGQTIFAGTPIIVESVGFATQQIP
jgi:restriction endonuclease S subunit